MATHPDISVILPFFNAEATLSRAVESILHQTFTNFELILVDDGSTDRSLKVAQRYDRDLRVQVICQEHQGVVAASIRGLTGSRGSLIARMDADDAAHPERLRLQNTFLEEHPNIGAVGSLVSYAGKVENGGFKTYVDWSNSIINTEDIWRNQFVEMPVVNPTLMIRRPFIDQLGWYREGTFPEDYELILRYLAAGVEFAKVNMALLDWHDSESRLTRVDERYSTEAFYQVKSSYLVQWLEQHNPHHPEVWVWGGGKLSRRRSDLLRTHGTTIAGYIDVRSRQLTEPCILFHDLPAEPDRFILTYVGNRGKRDEIGRFLAKRGYVEGEHFLHAS